MQPNAKRLLVVGAGGHAKVVIQLARMAGWEPVAAFAPTEVKTVLGVPVVGDDTKFEEFWRTGKADAAVIALGNNRLRQKLAAQVRALGCPTPVILHPSVCLCQTASVEQGTVIMAGAVINADARIGADCIINTSAIVEHDCVLADGVHAAPRSVMGGCCSLGTATLFGIGAVARPDITIGAHVTIGAGAVVVSGCEDGAVLVGNPAQPLIQP